LAFQSCQPAQLHIQNGLGLHLGQSKLFVSIVRGGLGVFALANGLNNRIHTPQGDAQSLQNMGALAALSKSNRCGG